ncbi:MAG: cis-Golgi t-SNARE syntaxin [Cirrosporium novae-zelandiae]|nr:MAG: cis-Golgi t-SNARE syntaxin [Cirrosporium novae-zelandiae]
MAVSSIQDRTVEFRSILSQAQKRQSSNKTLAQRQSLLSESKKREVNGHATNPRSARSEFAREAAKIGRGIASAVTKLERLAELARRKTLFDDRPTEINELTFVIKQDLVSLNGQISTLEAITKAQHPGGSKGKDHQIGLHNENVCKLLQGKLADVSLNFKEVLEVRSKNVASTRQRTDQFISSVSSQAAKSNAFAPRSDSPLYANNSQNAQVNGFRGHSANPDLLTLDAPSNSASPFAGQSSHEQLLMMEEASPQNSYIQQRGEAIEMIERTINELGSIFGQLAGMVSEQGEMIQRIDANTEDVVDNVEGAERELMRYWGRVKGNRWLVAKMFGVLMVCPIFLPIYSRWKDANS